MTIQMNDMESKMLEAPSHFGPKLVLIDQARLINEKVNESMVQQSDSDVSDYVHERMTVSVTPNPDGQVGEASPSSNEDDTHKSNYCPIDEKVEPDKFNIQYSPEDKPDEMEESPVSSNEILQDSKEIVNLSVDDDGIDADYDEDDDISVGSPPSPPTSAHSLLSDTKPASPPPIPSPTTPTPSPIIEPTVQACSFSNISNFIKASAAAANLSNNLTLLSNLSRELHFNVSKSSPSKLIQSSDNNQINSSNNPIFSQCQLNSRSPQDSEAKIVPVSPNNNNVIPKLQLSPHKNSFLVSNFLHNIPATPKLEPPDHDSEMRPVPSPKAPPQGLSPPSPPQPPPPPPQLHHRINNILMIPPTQRQLKFSIDNILKPEFGYRRYSDESESECQNPVDLSRELKERRDAYNSPPPLRGALPNIGGRSGGVPRAPPPPTSTGNGGSASLTTETGKLSSDTDLWPAWVFCTRYSDRPSAGPRTRRIKRRDKKEEKRPRTAFTSDQLGRLKREFTENRYLTEKRRQDLARDLGLNESQIKIWFQNKRAKIKKTTGQKNPLALQLMAQGLYNHSTIPVREEDEEQLLQHAM